VADVAQAFTPQEAEAFIRKDELEAEAALVAQHFLAGKDLTAHS
jgi:hypothetical protein